MQDLPFEIIQKILKDVEFTHTYQMCTLVCSHWNNIIKNKQFLIHKMQDNLINYPNSYRDISNIEFELCKKYFSKDNFGVAVLCNGCSSVKNSFYHFLFSIAEHPNCYWASKPSTEPTDEFLTFKIIFDIFIVKEISLKYMEHDGRSYSPLSIKVDFIKNETIFYTQTSNDVERIIFPKDIFLIQDCVVRVNFIGKREKADYDNKYYIGVRNILFCGKGGLSFPFYFDQLWKKRTQDELSTKRGKIIYFKNCLYGYANQSVMFRNKISFFQHQEFTNILNNMLEWDLNYQ